MAAQTKETHVNSWTVEARIEGDTEHEVVEAWARYTTRYPQAGYGTMSISNGIYQVDSKWVTRLQRSASS